MTKKELEEIKEKRVKVFLKERAFLSIVLSVVEVYKKETMGILLGFGGGDEYIIEYAIPYQTAEKGFTWVEPRERMSERMLKIVESLPIDLIGDYHSHTELGDSKAKAHPSGVDIDSMEEGKIYLIVAINDKEKEEDWKMNTDGSISGTVTDFHIQIAGFYMVSDYKYRRAEIICPSATGIAQYTKKNE